MSHDWRSLYVADWDYAFRNRRRSVAYLMVGIASFIWLTLTLTLTLTHVNQIYIRYFKERGMCYKTNNILKKTLKNLKQLLKKILKK